MKTLKDFKAECMRDEEFARTYDEQKPEFDRLRTRIDTAKDVEKPRQELTPSPGRTCLGRCR